MKTLTIGRENNNNIVLNDSFISRRHAEILLYDDGKVSIKDLGSSNGTFVNGNRISECYLKSNDQVKCGTVLLNWEQYAYSRPEFKSQVVNKKKPFIIGSYAFVLILFFTPFCVVKCSNTTIKSFTGTQLMMGTSINTPSESIIESAKIKQIDPNPFLIVAFVSALLGLAILLIQNTSQFKISFFCGVLGILSFIVFAFKLQSEIKGPTADSFASVSVDFTFTFWLTSLLFLCGGILSYMEAFPPTTSRST